jgi:hypothetical protein
MVATKSTLPACDRRNPHERPPSSSAAQVSQSGPLRDTADPPGRRGFADTPALGALA